MTSTLHPDRINHILTQMINLSDQLDVDNLRYVFKRLATHASRRHQTSICVLPECPFKDTEKHWWEDVRRLFKNLASCNMRISAAVHHVKFGFLVASTTEGMEFTEETYGNDTKKISISITGNGPVCLAATVSTLSLLAESRRNALIRWQINSQLEKATKVMEDLKGSKRKPPADARQVQEKKLRHQASSTASDVSADGLSEPSNPYDVDLRPLFDFSDDGQMLLDGQTRQWLPDNIEDFRMNSPTNEEIINALLTPPRPPNLMIMRSPLLIRPELAQPV